MEELIIDQNTDCTISGQMFQDDQETPISIEAYNIRLCISGNGSPIMIDDGFSIVENAFAVYLSSDVTSKLSGRYTIEIEFLENSSRVYAKNISLFVNPINMSACI